MSFIGDYWGLFGGLVGPIVAYWGLWGWRDLLERGLLSTL